MHSLKSYVTGYVLSLLLILAAFVLAVFRVVPGLGPVILLGIILLLAVVQAVVQLKFFLHLGQGSRGNLMLVFFTLGLIIIIVGGSIWIMNHLNYNMTPTQMMQYMNDQSTF
jgi:cytochrome o ubiquinol oxidase operon protein cyoD